MTGNADRSDLADITDTTTSNLLTIQTFVSTNNGYTEIRTDSTNLTYNPYTNRLTVANFRSTTDFEVQGNLNITGNIIMVRHKLVTSATMILMLWQKDLQISTSLMRELMIVLLHWLMAAQVFRQRMMMPITFCLLLLTFGEINTDNVDEGSSNRYLTQARTRNAFTYGTGIQHDGSGTISVTQSDIDTDNVTEGSTNIFFTNARARGAFSASGDLGYNASTGVFSFTERTDAEVNALADTAYWTASWCKPTDLKQSGHW